MRLCVSPAAIAALVILAAPLAARATVTFVSETRTLTASATATDNTGTSSQGPLTVSAPAAGVRWNSNNSVIASASRLGAGGSGSAIQVSGWTIAGALTLDAQGSASVSTNVFAASGGISAGGSATHIFDAVFDVTAGTALAYQGALNGNAVVRLENLTTSQVLFTGGGFYNNTIGPARIRIHAEVVASFNSPPDGSSSGGYSFSFSATPAPGAAALFALAVPLAMRRRRS